VIGRDGGVSTMFAFYCSNKFQSVLLNYVSHKQFSELHVITRNVQISRGSLKHEKILFGVTSGKIRKLKKS